MSTVCIVPIEQNHSSPPSTVVKMAHANIFLFIFLTSTITLIYGLNLDPLRAKSDGDVPTEEECMRPPMRRNQHECCRLPKERIWGDMQGSIHKCLRKFKPGGIPMMNDEEGSENSTTEATEKMTTMPSTEHRRGKKSLSERIAQIFATAMTVVKNSFDALRQTVVMITDHYPHRLRNDSCFMECVFEDQGFLLNNLVHKNALIERFQRTLQANEQWHKVALTAIEFCYQSDLQLDEKSSCQSGSEQIFRCVSKYLFFNCPNWFQNDYCRSLRTFYEKCPNGPPPDMKHAEPTSIPEEMTTEFATTTEENPDD